MPTTSGESSIPKTCPCRTDMPASASRRTTRPANCANRGVTRFPLKSTFPGTAVRTGKSTAFAVSACTLEACSGANTIESPGLASLAVAPGSTLSPPLLEMVKATTTAMLIAIKPAVQAMRFRVRWEARSVSVAVLLTCELLVPVVTWIASS